MGPGNEIVACRAQGCRPGCVGKIRQCPGRLVGEALRNVEGDRDSAGLADEVAGSVTFVVRDLGGEQRAELGTDDGIVECMKHWERVDALEEIVAGGLAGCLVGGDDIEDVVNDLEGHAVRKPELGE